MAGEGGGIINVENECEITFKKCKEFIYIYKSDSESETVHFMLGILEPFLYLGCWCFQYGVSNRRNGTIKPSNNNNNKNVRLFRTTPEQRI